MGMTMAQKILAHHALGQVADPELGTIIRAQPDGILLNDVSGPLAFTQFRAMGGIEVANPEAVVLVSDHFAPAPTLAAAQGLSELRRFAEEQHISRFFEVGQGGIEHTLLPERGFVAPAQLINHWRKFAHVHLWRVRCVWYRTGIHRHRGCAGARGTLVYQSAP